MMHIENSSVANLRRGGLALALLQVFLARGGLAPVHAAPGQEKWEFHTGGTIHGTAALGTNGAVYFGSTDGKLYAVDGSTGRLKWSFQTADFVTASPSVAGDGTVYLSSVDGRVYALDPQNGQTKWQSAPTSPIWSSPAIRPEGRLYLGVFEEGFVGLNASSGRPTWWCYIYPWSAAAGSAAIGNDDTVFIGGGTAYYAIDGRSGALRWTFRCDNAASIDIASSPAIGADGTVYVSAPDGVIYALDPSSGLTKWRFPTGPPVFSSPALGADGKVYVGSNNGKFYALDGATGRKEWQFEAGAFCGSAAVGADGTVYVGSEDQKLYALDAQTGQKQWEFPTDSGFWNPAPAIAPGGTLYIGTWNGTLYAIESASVGGLADSPWPKVHRDARNTGQAPAPVGPPHVTALFDSRVLLSGAATNLWLQVIANPPATVQWFQDGAPLPWGTNRFLSFPNGVVYYGPDGLPQYGQSVSPTNAGTYTAVVSNALGVVTTDPVVLGVNNVVSSNYLGLILSAPQGTALQIETADSVRGPWADLASLTLLASPYVFVDTNRATAGQRFYRTTSADRLGARLCRGWTFTAPAASRFRIDYVEAQLGYTNWQFLTNLTLPQTPYLFVDTTTTNRQPRFYRTTPLP